MSEGTRRLSPEGRQALFWALLVARCAGEAHVTSARISNSLLRTASAIDFCERLDLNAEGLAAAADIPGVRGSDECRRVIEAAIVDASLEVGSPEHIASVRPLPIDDLPQQIIHALLSSEGQPEIAPLELLLALFRADGELRARLVASGLTEEKLREA